MTKAVNFLDARLPNWFWDSTQPCPMSGCWLWVSPITGAGYGHRCIDGRDALMHRLSYSTLIGPIDSETLDHKCRVRCCVNPAHLEPVTHRENILRGAGITAEAARKTHCANGHPFDDENTSARAENRRHRRCRACGREWWRLNKLRDQVITILDEGLPNLIGTERDEIAAKIVALVEPYKPRRKRPRK